MYYPVSSRTKAIKKPCLRKNKSPKAGEWKWKQRISKTWNGKAESLLNNKTRQRKKKHCHHQNPPWSPLSLSMGPPGKCGWCSWRDSIEENGFSLCQQIPTANSMWVRVGPGVHFSLHRACACCHSVWVHIHTSPAVSGRLTSLESPITSALTTLLPPPPHRSLSLRGMGLTKTAHHLGLSVLRSLTLCTLSSYGTLC